MTKKTSQEKNVEQKEEMSVDTSKSEAKEIERLRAELEEANAKAESHWEKLLRKEAELQNFRKRAETDVSNARKFGIERFAEELLAVIDSFEQAQSIEIKEDNASAVLEGMQLTHKVMLDVLHKFGVKVIDPKGENFDPQFHEAMSMQESSEAKPNEVLIVIQKGFLMHDRVLRPARVIVARAPQATPQA